MFTWHKWAISSRRCPNPGAAERLTTIRNGVQASNAGDKILDAATYIDLPGKNQGENHGPRYNPGGSCMRRGYRTDFGG